MSKRLERRSVDLIEVKVEQESDKVGRISGYGAVFGNIDSYGDVIARGAFADTLKTWQVKGTWPKMLLQHGGMGIGADDMLPVGTWTEMAENAKGLKVDGQLFALNTERGQYIYEGLKSGALDGLSIGFEVVTATQGNREDDFERRLDAVDLWEVSIVTFPANDLARVTAVKTLSIDQMRDLESILGERGLSCRDRVRAVSAFKTWLSREANAPGIAARDEPAPELEPETADLIAAIERATGTLWRGALRR